MGSIAARKAKKILDHVGYILATEVYCATQALRFRLPLKPGLGVEAAFRFMADRIEPITQDRVFAPEVAGVLEWIQEEEFMKTVESATGGLR